MNNRVKVSLIVYVMGIVMCFGHAFRHFDNNCKAGMYENLFAGCSVGERALGASLLWPLYVSYSTQSN